MRGTAKSLDVVTVIYENRMILDLLNKLESAVHAKQLRPIELVAEIDQKLDRTLSESPGLAKPVSQEEERIEEEQMPTKCPSSRVTPSMEDGERQPPNSGGMASIIASVPL